jgi:hypothetical protein
MLFSTCMCMLVKTTHTETLIVTGMEEKNLTRRNFRGVSVGDDQTRCHGYYTSLSACLSLDVAVIICTIIACTAVNGNTLS